jgi:protein-disulfide isomerase
LISYAVELGIDSAVFTAKMETTEVAEQVQADAQLGRDIGISATPTIYVNGIETPAPQLLSAVQGLINSPE